MRADELIEAMARAMFKPDQLNRLDIAKAMLAIARPIIEAQERERCARIAEEGDDGTCWTASERAIAAAIRSNGDD